jgi:uncharacterized protein YfaS (alpha-2-macroglobulin family)
MSRRGLLSLLCLSVLSLSLVPLTHAGGEIKVDESRIRVLIHKQPVEVQLTVENSTGESVDGNVELELLDPRDHVEREQKVDLEIKPENWFALLGPARKQMSIPACDARRETFDFRATASVDDGKQRVTASGSDANDAIEKPITVHPDGEELIITAGDILGSSATLDLNLPEKMIRDSERAELKIYPNLMSHVIEGVEAIMQRPYGCAEQSISATYPSLMLLRHYKQTGNDFPFRARAERYLNDGYSRLLNYREEEGGFS